MPNLICCFSDANQNDDAQANHAESPDSTPATGLLDRIWQNPWLVFLLPFVVYLLLNSLEPTPNTAGGARIGLSISYDYYPWVYTLKIALTMVAIMLVWPAYRQFPLKASWLAVTVGVIGVVLWVGLSKLHLESYLPFEWFQKMGQRTAFNPFEHYQANPLAAWCFLSVRFFGLAMVVPVIEEFFLRGFLMRFFVERDWWKVSIGTVTWPAIIAGTVFPMLSHPAELIAAAVWFSMVTWLMIRTKNIWDCVVAHMVTNGLLGVYVVVSGDWFFW